MFRSNKTPTTNNQTSSGYVLVVVLLVIFMGVLLIGLSTALAVTNARQQTMGESKKRLQHATDSAIENAILILLRKPTYQGELFTIDDIDVELHVATGSPTYISAVATAGGQIQQADVIVDRVNGMLEVQSWLYH